MDDFTTREERMGRGFKWYDGLAIVLVVVVGYALAVIIKLI